MRFFLICAFLVTLLFLTSSALRIICDYRSVGSFITECQLSSLTVNNRSDTVTSVSGTLPAILNYEAIKILRIKSSPNLEVLPSGLDNFFGNIETFEVTETGLSTLTAADLKMFPNVTKLVLKENHLKILESSVFEFNPKLKEIDLSRNELMHFSGNFFKFLPDLKSVDLTNNACINETAENQFEILRLKVKISEKCGSEISYVKSSFSFLGLCLVAVLFLVLLMACIKLVIEK